jgi:glyceraldehyde 3-phosphate dehydrogenase
MRPAAQRVCICVVCDVMPIDYVAYLLAHDSSYGRPPFSVEYEGDELMLDNFRIHYLRVDRRRNLADNDTFAALKSFELDVLLDATGTAELADFQTLLAQNICKKILCTWNIKGGDISLVYGVNHQAFQADKHQIISASTCTGNAIVPICQILETHIGISYGRIITIHPQLSDQRILDGYHSTPQLGRNSAISIIPTSTNVVKSTELILPSLTNKLDGLSYRVPTAIVSTIDFSVTLSRDTSLEEISFLFNQYAQEQFAQIVYCDYGAWGHQKASIDYLGSEYSAIILMQHLTLSQQRHVGIALMHDNEYGYCCRVLNILGVITAE